MSKLQELVKKYGKVAIGVHLGIYAATLAGCYVAAERKLDLEHYLVKYNLLKVEDLRADGNPEDRSWLAKVLTSSGSSFAIAFVCTKALLPIRLPLTVAVTPAVASKGNAFLGNIFHDLGEMVDVHPKSLRMALSGLPSRYSLQQEVKPGTVIKL